MKQFFRKIWIWILSGLSVILGGCSDVSCLYGPPKVYGPPPPNRSYDFEKVYGPPVQKVEVDSVDENVEEPLESEGK